MSFKARPCKWLATFVPAIQFKNLAHLRHALSFRRLPDERERFLHIGRTGLGFELQSGWSLQVRNRRIGCEVCFKQMAGPPARFAFRPHLSRAFSFLAFSRYGNDLLSVATENSWRVPSHQSLHDEAKPAPLGGLFEALLLVLLARSFQGLWVSHDLSTRGKSSGPLLRNSSCARHCNAMLQSHCHARV